jgi:hypothetical protein
VELFKVLNLIKKSVLQGISMDGKLFHGVTLHEHVRECNREQVRLLRALYLFDSAH